MKNLSKVIAILMALMVVSQSFGQSVYVHAGGSLANMLVEDDQDVYSDDYELNTGFTVGVSAYFPVSPTLSVGSGLSFLQKGYAVSFDLFGAAVESNFTLNYVQVPLVARLNIPAGGLNIIGQAGLYGGYAVSGKTILTVEADGEKETEEEDVDWDDESNIINRADFGLDIGAGIEMKGIQLMVSYQHGLANVVDTEKIGEDSAYMGHRVISVTIGYRLSGN